MPDKIDHAPDGYVLKTYGDFRQKLDGCVSRLEQPKSLLEKAITACFGDKDSKEIKETAKTVLITMTNMAVLDLEEGKKGQALSQANEVFAYNRRLFKDTPIGNAIEKECVRIGVATLEPPTPLTP